MNQVLIGLLAFAIATGVILFLIYDRLPGLRPRAVLLSALSGRWEGRVREGGILSGDRLEIRVDGVAGEVTFADETERYSGWTRLRLDWRSARRLRVATKDIISQVRRLLSGT